MKAAVYHEHGGPEKVVIESVGDPRPGQGEVLLDVRAAALNHLDLWVLKGGRGPERPFPRVLGSDACGTVAELGAAVTGLKVGDEVVVSPGLHCGACPWCNRGQHSECPSFGIIGLSRDGTYAERVAVPAVNVQPKPAHLDHHEAAALTLAFLTAWRMLMTRAAVQAGETVLIHGIGGGVATAALQLAKLAACRVIVTSSSDEKLARAKELGADETINYRQTDDVAKAVLGLTDGAGVDVAVDTVGAATWPVDIAAVRRGGRVVICGVTTGASAPTDLRAVYWNQLTLLGSTLGSRDEFRQMLLAVSAGGLKPVIDRVLPLSEARKALERMDAGKQFGKIVLSVR